MKWSHLLKFIASSSLLLTSYGSTTFTPVNYGAPSIAETDAFNRINNFRADPQNELFDIFVEQGYGNTKSSFDTLLQGQTSYTAGSGWWSTNVGPGSISGALDFFSVVPSTIASQFAALPAAGTLNNYSWSNNTGWAAHQYSVWVEQDAGTTANPHAIPGAPSLGDRFTNAGNNWGNAGENIAPNFTNDTFIMHSGFAIDWGFGPDGIQDPAGHRNSMLSSTFTHIGIGMVDDGWTIGNQTQTQHFFRQLSTDDPIFYGYLSAGSGTNIEGVSVEVYDAGGTSLGTTTTDKFGAYTIQFSGGTPAYAEYTHVDGLNESSQGSTFGTDGTNFFINAIIPEPSSSILTLLGLGGLAFRRSRKA